MNKMLCTIIGLKEKMKILIQSEDDALNYLESLLDGKLQEDISGVDFQGWPNLNVYISGESYHSSLKTSQMKAFLKLQKAIYYQAETLLGVNIDSLEKDKKDLLELNVKIKEGSSDLILAIDTILNTILSTGISTKEVLDSVVALGAIYGSSRVALRYFESKDTETQQKPIEAVLVLARENRELSIENRKLYEVAKSATDALNTISNSAPDSKLLKINGVEVSRTKKRKNKKLMKSSASTFLEGKKYELDCRVVGIKDEGKGRYECRFKDSASKEILVWSLKRSEISESLAKKIKGDFNSERSIKLKIQIEKSFKSGGKISVVEIYDRKPRSFKNGKHNK